MSKGLRGLWPLADADGPEIHSLMLGDLLTYLSYIRLEISETGLLSRHLQHYRFAP